MTEPHRRLPVADLTPRAITASDYVGLVDVVRLAPRKRWLEAVEEAFGPSAG